MQHHQEPVHRSQEGAVVRHGDDGPLEPVERSLEQATVSRVRGGDENDFAAQQAVAEATGRARERAEPSVSEGQVMVLASGNLGLIYLMEAKHRLSLEEIEQRHPRLLTALREHPHVGFVLVHSAEHGAVVLGPRGARYLAEDRTDGEDPLGPFSANAPRHLLRSDGFEHAPDIYVNSFYDPFLEEGCAFEELISFHGGLGGPQTRPFVLHPAELPGPEAPLVGAASVHGLLRAWRQSLQGAT